jgi:nitrogen fixation NifU-like protein
MEFYSKKVMDHFMHPKNLGKLDNADGVGVTENLRCGDSMKIYIKVNKDKIKDIKFQTLGCGHAIAISDMICELAKNKTVEQAKEITLKDVIRELGEIPNPKIHCVSLAEVALKSAIKDYEERRV